MKNLALISLALGAFGCQTEYDLTAAPGTTPGDAPTTVGGARALPETHTVTARKDAEVVDYLFVVDPSVSMLGVLKEVRAGFTSLGEAGFPRGARIAVLTMTPAAMDGSGRPNATVGDAQAAIDDPGFQRLIRGTDIAKFHGIAGGEPGAAACGDDGWFSADARLPDGTPCVAAVMEMPLYASNSEAGLLALKQFLVARGDKPLFRDGAAANIVFVSDTHDPGLPEGAARDSLVRVRPTHGDLEALIGKANVVSSLRMHAIAPQTVCVDVEDWSGLGTVYYDVALASGGHLIDVCTATDYAKLLRDMTWAGARPTHALLSNDAKSGEIDHVEVNGKPVAWSLHRDDTLLRIDERLGDADAEVKVFRK